MQHTTFVRSVTLRDSLAVGTLSSRVPDILGRDRTKCSGRLMNLQPLGDRLIVEALEEEEVTVSGIVLPDTAREKPQRARRRRRDLSV